MTSSPHSTPIDRAETLVKEAPLRAIDAALRALGATRGSRTSVETEHYVDVLATAVLNACPSDHDDHPDRLQSLLEDKCHESLACATLLRLLVQDDDVLRDVRFISSTAMFDRLAAPIYSEIGLKAKAQNYDKRDALRRFTQDYEERLARLPDSLTSLASIPGFRQSFAKLYNAKSTRLLVTPFLPLEISRQAISDLLTAGLAVADAADTDALDSFKTVSHQCESIIHECEDVGTEYATTLLGSIALRVRELARETARSRGLVDPAQLAIEARPKSYPLVDEGARATLRINLVNNGPGQARDVSVSIEGHAAISFDRERHTIEVVNPGTHRVDFEGTVTTSRPDDAVLVKATWSNADETIDETETIVELRSQQFCPRWDELEYADPYPLEPATIAERFVGRESVLKSLVKGIVGRPPGNARIIGQRRVGKTSIAHAVASRVAELRPDQFVFVFVEAGDFNATTPEETLSRLGTLIFERVTSSKPALKGIDRPDFSAGISPLAEVFATAAERDASTSFVIVVDEFDSIAHPELYDRGPLGEALFQSLRSLGGKPNVGFMLVGGERMKWIVAAHGMSLNKFQLVPVDYFEETQLDDYFELVAGPIRDVMTIDDDAIRRIFHLTAGNPWITKLVAREVFARQVDKRDSDIRVDDVDDALPNAIASMGATSFQHFWDDAIQGDTDEQHHVSVIRRKVLLGLASCLREGQAATEANVARAARKFEIDERTTDDVIRGLRERNILISRSDSTLACRVPIFERWLVEEGVREIVVSLGDDDVLIRRQRAQEAMRPRDAELDELAKRWRVYAGQVVEPHRVREWLNQFGQPSTQRLALRMLDSLRYYNSSLIGEKLQEVHGWILRQLAGAGYEYTMVGRQRTRGDLLICGLEGGGSGAAHLVKRYRDENGIVAASAVDSGEVARRIDESTRAIVIVEDFIATGGTARSRIKRLHEQWTSEPTWRDDIDVFLVAICAFESGLENARRAGDRLPWRFTAHAADSLDDRDRCFRDESAVFPDEDERAVARAFCLAKGEQLVSKFPLGFGDSEALVCFEHRCPNNSLPVLWKSSPTWKALFPRG